MSGWLSHRVILDEDHRLLVTLSYFGPDRFVQLLCLIPILILLLYFRVSIDLVCTDIVARLDERKSNCFHSEIYSSLAETINKFSLKNYCKFHSWIMIG